MAKITFVVVEVTLKWLISLLQGPRSLVVAEITFKVAVSTSSMAKIIFIVAEITFKVIVITPSVVNISL